MPAGDVLIETTGTPGGDVTLDSAGDVVINAAGDVIVDGTVLELANLPSTDEKAALAGTEGTPDAGNPYVTDEDSRLIDAERLLLTALGLKAETYNAGIGVSDQLLVSGDMLLAAVVLRAGDVITNLLATVSNGGSGLTLVKFGIYSTAGVLLASTADVKAAYTSFGPKTNALSAPWTVLTTGAHYFAVLATGTTPPTLRRGGAEGFGGYNAFGGGIRRAALQSGLADLPASATIADGSRFLWIGAS